MKKEKKLVYKPPRVELYLLKRLSFLEDFSLDGEVKDWDDGGHILDDESPDDWFQGGNLGTY